MRRADRPVGGWSEKPIWVVRGRRGALLGSAARRDPREPLGLGWPWKRPRQREPRPQAAPSTALSSSSTPPRRPTSEPHGKWSYGENKDRRPGMLLTTPQDVGPFFRRNVSACGNICDQIQPRLTTPNTKPTPAWLGSAMRRSRAITKKRTIYAHFCQFATSRNKQETDGSRHSTGV